jgi:NNP family nitrate/nitrite transporter-like MFS transporter
VVAEEKGRVELSRNAMVIAGGFIALFLLNVLNTSYSTVLALIKDDLGLTYTMSGALMSAYFTGYTIGQIPWGTLADRYGPKKVMVTSILGIASATILFGASNEFWQILLARFLAGLLGAGVFVPSVKLVSGWFSPATRGTALGVLSVGGSVGLVVTSWLIPYASLKLGWRGAMITSGLIGLASTTMLWVTLRDRPSPPVTHRVSVKVSEVARTGGFWILAWVQLIRLGANYTFTAWLPLILREELGLSLIAAGAIFSMLNVAGMVANPLGGFASDRVGEKMVIAVSFAALCCATFVFSRTRNIFVVYAAVLIMGWFINFVRSPSFAVLPKLYGVDSAGQISGVHNTFAALGALLLPLLLGFLKDITNSYWAGWLILSGTLLSVSVFSLFLVIPVKVVEDTLNKVDEI